jgi:pimeloyl-ACP methyl ester carboxylesterase
LAFDMHEEPLELTTPAGKLSGTLALPGTRGPWPVVLLIAGAGPADRDGNSALLPGAPGHMRRLAQALVAKGIASLRYDKRGVGASVHPGLQEEDLRFRHLVDDAVALAGRLRADPRLGTLLLLGHSEGALVAKLAARDAPAQAVVSVAGAGMRACDLMREQLQAGCLSCWRRPCRPRWPPSRTSRRWTTRRTRCACCSAPPCSPT